MNRGYRPEDFDQDRSAAIIGFMLFGVVGFAMGVGATLFLQWLAS